MKRAVALKINGDTHELLVSTHATLLDVLREKLGLMGTKRGCDLGACGACTVLIDGEAYLSCLMLAVDAIDKEILTIEGLSEGGSSPDSNWNSSRWFAPWPAPGKTGHREGGGLKHRGL